MIINNIDIICQGYNDQVLCMTAKSIPILSRPSTRPDTTSIISTRYSDIDRYNKQLMESKSISHRVAASTKQNIMAGEFPYEDPSDLPCPSPYLRRLRELSDMEQRTYQRDTFCNVYGSGQQRQFSTRLAIARPNSSHGRIDSSRVRRTEAEGCRDRRSETMTKPAMNAAEKRSRSVTSLPISKPAVGGVKTSQSDISLSKGSFSTKHRLKRTT